MTMVQEVYLVLLEPLVRPDLQVQLVQLGCREQAVGLEQQVPLVQLVLLEIQALQVQLDCRAAVGLLANLEQVVLQALQERLVIEVRQVRQDQLVRQEHLEPKVQPE